MADYLMLMHGDASNHVDEAAWTPYLDHLGSAGVLRGGSAIGAGECVRRQGPTPAVTTSIVGYIKVDAGDIDQVRALLAGNPVYEAGGTVEIRMLPSSEG